MLHIRRDYNRRIQDSENKIPADEPVFLLRSSDFLAPFLVQEWAKRMRSFGCQAMADKAMDHAYKMIEWQNANGMKIADCPKNEM